MSIPVPSSSLVASSAAAAAATVLELRHESAPCLAGPLHTGVNPAGEARTAQAPDGNEVLALVAQFDDPWPGDAPGDGQQKPVLTLLGYR